jgi:hypothetical protein
MAQLLARAQLTKLLTQRFLASAVVAFASHALKVLSHCWHGVGPNAFAAATPAIIAKTESKILVFIVLSFSN